MDEISPGMTAQNASECIRAQPQQPCLNCAGLYTPKRKWQHFCGVECRKAYHRGKASSEARIGALEREVKELKRQMETIQGFLVFP